MRCETAKDRERTKNHFDNLGKFKNIQINKYTEVL